MRLGISLCLVFGILTYIVSIQIKYSFVTAHLAKVPLQIRLHHDADYLPELSVDIWQVRIQLKESKSWINMNTKSGLYKIASSNNEPSYVIAEDLVPKDSISQIHLILGPHNAYSTINMKENVRTNRLGTQNIKIPVDVALTDSQNNFIELIFNTSASIKMDSYGQKILDPVFTVRTYPRRASPKDSH